LALGSSTVLQSWGKTTGGLFSWLTGSITSTVESVMMVMRNFDDIWMLAQLDITEFVGNAIAAVDSFAENIGRISAWIGRNWANMLVDLTDHTGTIFSNLIDNAVTFGRAWWDAVMGNPVNFKFKSLADGFVAATEKFPELAQPAWVEMAKERDEILGRIGAKEAEYANKKAKRAAEIAVSEKEGAGGGKADKAKGETPEKEKKGEFADLAAFAQKLQLGAFGKDATVSAIGDLKNGVVGELKQIKQAVKAQPAQPGFAVGEA